MNGFRAIGDSSHLFAIFLLIFKICYYRSCSGISGKSQILFTTVYTARYLDLTYYFISYYNSIMKIIYLVASYGTLYLIYIHFRKTLNRELDPLRIEILLALSAVLALLFNYQFAFPFLEITWTFSIFLESVAILPQLVLILKSGEAEKLIPSYLCALVSYRAFYIINWRRAEGLRVTQVTKYESLKQHDPFGSFSRMFELVIHDYIYGAYTPPELIHEIYRYYMQGYSDLISVCSGTLQLILTGVAFAVCLSEKFRNKVNPIYEKTINLVSVWNELQHSITKIKHKTAEILKKYFMKNPNKLDIKTTVQENATEDEKFNILDAEKHVVDVEFLDEKNEVSVKIGDSEASKNKANKEFKEGETKDATQKNADIKN